MAPPIVRHACSVLAFLAAGSAGAQDGAACLALESRAPNAAGQRPAFAGQSRACPAAGAGAVALTVFAQGLEHPWAVEPLPDGALLVTERPGRMRVIAADGRVGAPLAGVPEVAARGQGGLLDVALGPMFASDRSVYWSYTEARDGGVGTSVARGVLAADRTRLDAVQVILRARNVGDGGNHFGSRLAFGPDGMLYVTLGDRGSMRPQARALATHVGKILRIRPDGGVPPDNPYVGRADARPEIWSLGHRNIQGAAFDAQGRLWEVEMGTRGGDEVNRIDKGRDYGWPEAAYGVEYSGAPIGGGATTRAGTEQPVYYWDPSIAPSGAQWYDHDARPAWRGNLFVGALAGRALIRLTFDSTGRVNGEERLLTERARRIRDVRQGADGALWVVTDDADGEVWKLTPAR